MVVFLTAVGALAAHGTPADEVALQPKPTEITLYTQNIAEVTAVASHFGEGDITLWLPRSIEKDTVVIEDGGKPLPHTLKPVLEKAKIGPEKTKEYLAKLSGLPAGEHNLLVRYRTRNLGWNPNYSLIVDKPGEGVLRSVISITNNALELNGVTLRLVSGQVQTAPYDHQYGGYKNLPMLLQMMSQMGRHIPSLPLSRDIREIQILHDMTVPERATRQLPVREVRLGVEELLVWDASMLPHIAPMTREPVLAAYILQNDTGRPLAEGKVKVYEKETFVGEGFMGWTLQGDKGTLALSEVKDLTVGREEKTEELPQTWEHRYITSLMVANQGNLPARVKIITHLPRTGLAGGRLRGRRGMGLPVETIYAFSEDPVITPEGLYSWLIDVPPGGEHTISYEYVRALDPSKFLVLQISCNDSPDEHRYLYEEHGSYIRPRDWCRYMDGMAYAIYRLDLQDTLERADMIVRMSGNFVISLALDKRGKPGTFRTLARSDIYYGEDLHRHNNLTEYYFDLSPYLSRTKDNVLYVKFEDGSKQDKWGPMVYYVEIYRIPKGFPSRGRDYMRKGLTSRPQPQR